MTKTILSLDIGVKSIGGAFVKQLGPIDYDPVWVGVRTFEPGYKGTQNDWEKGLAESRCKDRRDARSRRRVTRRRRKRLSLLFEILQRHNLLPSGNGTCPQDRHDFFLALDDALTKKAISEGFINLQSSGLPYWLRRKALYEPITPHEFGRILYHITQRRGFKSNRKGAPREDSEMLQEIESLDSEIRESGAKTIGEYLSHFDSQDAQIRCRHTSRKMYEEEFNTIWEAQSKYHPDILSKDLKKEIHRAIFFQRKVNSKKGIRRCSYEPEAVCAPKWSLSAQRFRLLQLVNNIRVIHPDGEVFSLTDNRYTVSRMDLINHLQKEGSLKLARVKKILKAPKKARLNYEEDDDGVKEIQGNKTYSAFRSFFGERWDSFSEKEQEDIIVLAMSFEKEEALRRKAERDWGLPPDKAEALSKFSPESGYMNLSLKAIRKLLPCLEEGFPLATAITKVYPDAKTAPKLAFVPPLDPKDPRINAMSPAVRRSLSEAIKFVNAFIRKFGKPDIIRIEFARDVKNGKKDRKRIYKENEQNKSERDEAITAIKKAVSEHYRPSERDIERYRLWKEANGQCVYCGRRVSVRGLINEDCIFDVDHIIPISRSFNDGLGNKVLACRECNQAKKNRTPYEAFGGEEYDRIIERAKSFTGRSSLKKLKLFQVKDLSDLNSDPTQTLNDTRYICVEAARHLACLYGGRIDENGVQRVQVTNGRITSILNKYSGFSELIGGSPRKNRNDHRHHALDAIYIAVTNSHTVRCINTAASRGYLDKMKSSWLPIMDLFQKDDFKEKVRNLLDNMIVSHKPRLRLRGALHEETHYGLGKGSLEGYVTKREALESITPSRMNQIIDPRMKTLVIEAFERGREIIAERDDKNPAKIQPRDVFKERELRPCFLKSNGKKVVVNSVKVAFKKNVIPVGKDARTRYIATGDNDHIEIFERTKKGGGKVLDLQAVSLLEAREQFLRTGSRFIKRSDNPNSRYLYSLFKGDTVLLTPPNGEEPFLAVVRGLSEGDIWVSRINSAMPRKLFVKDRKTGKNIEVDTGWIRLWSSRFRDYSPKKADVSILGEISFEEDLTTAEKQGIMKSKLAIETV